MWAESGGLSAEGFEEELFSNPSALGTFMVDDVFGPKVVQLKFWISILFDDMPLSAPFWHLMSRIRLWSSAESLGASASSTTSGVLSRSALGV